jgi:polyisoprenoid-binding protein YceI
MKRNKMKKTATTSILAIGLSLTLLSFILIQSLWTIPSTSKANFSINGMFGACNGTLDFTSSNLSFDPNNPAAASMEVVLSIASINTNSSKRDKHLKTDDFFDEAKYPAISFKSTSIQKADNGYAVTGNLKIKEVTKTVTIPFTFVPTGKIATFKGDFTINRMDYKVGEKQKFGVGKEVRIALNIPVNAK